MKIDNALYNYLIQLLEKYKYYLLALSFISLFSGCLNIVSQYIVRDFIDSIMLHPEAPYIALFTLFIISRLMVCGFNVLTGILNTYNKPKLTREIIESVYSKTMQRSLHWFDSHLSGEIVSKLTDFQDSIFILINTLTWSLSNFAVLFCSLFFLYYINVSAAFVLLIFILLYLPILTFLLKKQMDIQEDYVQARQEAVGIINDSISTIFNIKVIGNVWQELHFTLTPAFIKWEENDKKARHYDAFTLQIINSILITLMNSVQFILLIYLYKNHKITAGDFAFIAVITLNIHKELNNLLEAVLFNITPQIAILKSSFHFIHNVHSHTSSSAVLPRVEGDITFKDVTFGYHNHFPVFKNFSLHIKKGEHIGIVGASGAGKTTLVKALLRYFDVNEGAILLDNYDIREVSEESLRANIAVIPQDITLFHRSILDNLKLANHKASFEEIQEACKKAKINDDIMKMPKSYHSIVGERGIKISGGQRQRIAIALAILKNAPILICDEATSSLDSVHEILIQDALYKMVEESRSTVIMIAHRLSTLLKMDRIIVFHEGNIVQEGTHAELSTVEGHYKTMWETQIGNNVVSL